MEDGANKKPKPQKSKRKVVVSHSSDAQPNSGDSAYHEEALLASMKARPTASATPPPNFTSVTPEPSQTPTAGRQSGSTVPFFFSFIALLGTAAIGYMGFQLYHKVNHVLGHQNVAQQFQALTTENNQQSARIHALATALKKDTQAQSELDNLQTETIDNLQKQLMATQAQLTMASRSDQDWVLAEAQYLIRTAEQRLQAFEDVDTALIHLKAADDRLQRVGNPALLSVREAIAKDIVNLEQVEKPQREEIWLALGELEQQFQHLPLAKGVMSTVPEAQVEAEAPAPERPIWQAAGLKTWEELKSLIHVRHHKGPFQITQLTDQEGTLLLHAVTLQIAEARQAALQGNVKIYEGSLATLSQWLQRYFESSSKQAQIKARIEALQGQSIVFTPPQLSQAKQGIEAVLKQPASQSTGGASE